MNQLVMNSFVNNMSNIVAQVNGHITRMRVVSGSKAVTGRRGGSQKVGHHNDSGTTSGGLFLVIVPPHVVTM